MGSSAQTSTKKAPTNSELRNLYARVYYLTAQEWLIEHYKSLNGDLTWTGPAWFNFVNSAEFDRVVHEKLASMSMHTREMIAFCDQTGDFDEVVFEGAVTALCLPIMPHPRSELVVQLEGPSQGFAADAFGPVGIGQMATRQFIKAMATFFLKDILKMDFHILGRAGVVSCIWKINDKLEYEQLPL